MQGIYKIINKNNGKYYVGSSNEIKRRWRRHRSELNRNCHDNPKLQNAWNFHGEKSFVFEIIETLEGLTSEELKVAEDKYLKICEAEKESNYNCLYTAFINEPMPEDRKERMKLSLKKVVRTEEWRRKIGEANRRRGRLSEASIEKMRAKLRGRKQGPRSEEWKKNLSISITGKPKTWSSDEKRNEWRKNVGLGSRGHICSDETKRKMSETYKRNAQKRASEKALVLPVNERCSSPSSCHPKDMHIDSH